MSRFIRILVLLALLLATFAVPAASAQGGGTRSYLLVANGSLPGNLAQQVSAAGGTLVRTLPEIGMASAESGNPNFAKNMRGLTVLPNPTLQWVHPVQSVTVDAGSPPNSGDDDFFFDLQWGHDAIDAPEAWEAGYRGAGVRVAVLDTGFDLDHPDLAPNINLALSADMTGEGLQYTLPDVFSHGTHVAGTVAAADNAFGTIGVAPQAELVLVKVLGDEGSGSFEDVIAGIVHAANADADVINMSLSASVPRRGFLDDGGTPEDTSDDVWVGAHEVAALLNATGAATTYAYQQGTTVIAAAANDANDGDKDQDLVILPAQLPHVIAVSATGPMGWGVDPTTDLDVPAFYTNFGRSLIDLAAPGGNVDFGLLAQPALMCNVAGSVAPCWAFDLVFSTGNGGWFWSAGTSMAAPHAAGVAALIIGKHGGSLPPAQVEAALRASADDLGQPGNDPFYGAGRVNAYNAVAP